MSHNKFLSGLFQSILGNAISSRINKSFRKADNHFQQTINQTLASKGEVSSKKYAESLLENIESMSEQNLKALFDHLADNMEIDSSALSKTAADFSENGTPENLTKVNQDMEENNQSIDNNFEEIAPLISSFDFDLEKQKSDFVILDYESLPESVYMIVDKKVELDLQPISNLPEWSFLPENELQRNAILLFSNQRSAKRICSRNQRVIKIPNTSIFQISKSYLISKGITRLIL